MIVHYLRRQGRNEEARPFIDLLTEAGERDALAQRERSQLLLSDKLVPHQLEAGQMRLLVEQLANYAEVKKAYLARKQTKLYPDLPMYVLAIQRTAAWWKFESSSSSQKLIAQLCQELTCPGETLIVCVDGSNKNFRGKFKKVAGSEIYSKR